MSGSGPEIGDHFAIVVTELDVPAALDALEE
jgi:hypothetical protein